ncbi:hypothetical protein NJB1604_20260 [Mycobacterium marinum]|nr:hypothetical protein NJB1604_20260 [Mycobacterium marinum]
MVWAGAAAFAVLSADPTPAESAAADPSTSGIAITNDMCRLPIGYTHPTRCAITRPPGRD